MTKDMKFEWLNPKNVEQVERLKTFAASFGHSIDSLAHPIFIVAHQDQWVGYVQIVQQPIIFPAFKPDAASPRDIRDAMVALKGWTRIQFGSGFCTVPTDEETQFTPEVMAQLAMKRMNLELYEPE